MIKNPKNNFNLIILSALIDNILRFKRNNAFCINEKFYSYKQFGENISKIRERIKETKNEDIYFGLVANDDIETYASIFALWLEGKAYVPLHPKQPKERNVEIVNQVEVSHILDSGNSTDYIEYSVVLTSKLVYRQDFLEINPKINEETLLYILFTSGSTGKPKGVMISRKNVGAFMESFWETGINIDENDRCLQTFDLTFDVSVQSFLTPLTCGACVYTVPHEEIKYSYVFGLLEDHDLTFGAMAPSMLRFLKPYFEEIDLPKMKACIVTAEASPLELIEEWQNCIPNAQIYDFYGPTEATIYCTYYKVEKVKPNKSLNGMLSIGKALKNVHAIIIDEDENIVSDREKGELCVSGNQITFGYWNNRKKNKEAFFYKEINGKEVRFYHTGDLCFREDGGNLMLFGRKDSQVKIQGYRVELGEIEYLAREFLKGQEVVVLPFENSTNNTELAIFIETDKIDEKELDAYLKSKLPSYMIPTKKILKIPFPVNSSDKVDKKKLKELL